MSHKLQPARGTKDILADEYRVFSHVQNVARGVSSLYGFKEISTPIFEFTEIFAKTLGEESDVVGKEMYVFADRGGESVTLRPEFTAGIARAFISGGLSNQLPLKLFTTGALFRYERPQKGRQRQFHQINFEMLGVQEAQADVEIISMGMQILDSLGVSDKIKLEVNSLGDKESREKYRDSLVEYLNAFKNDLSEDSKNRLIKNPMRILDSKDENDKKIVLNAPVIENYYTPQAAEFFAQVKNGLDLLGIKYEVNNRLVRGLDYYCHTAFEFTTDALGSQNAVLAGGRYDGLISMMGGADTPAVGFAGGVERLVALYNGEIADKRPVVIIPIGDRAEKEANLLAAILRREGIYIELAYSGNVKKRMKKANSLNAKMAIIFGDDELDKKIVKLKNFDSGEEVGIEAVSLVDRLGDCRG